MEISALASGSSGNCFYVENDKDAVLIDAGISALQITARLEALKRNAEKIRAIFITHEHSDHTRGADVLARQLNIPIFATRKTIQAYGLCSDEDLLNPIKNNESADIGALHVEAFPKSHNAADPVAFSVSNGRKVSVITDLGYACENVIANVSDSDLLCMESNHDEIMVDHGPYPPFLKAWIKGDTGHLSNLQAALCVLEHSRSKLKNVVLSHISKTNNTNRLAHDTFSFLLKERKDLSPKISVSTREVNTPLFKV